ncbi:hypothetical protein ACJD0Z_04315 [Flavobacteriaceae bacterium M23B6Z8]
MKQTLKQYIRAGALQFVLFIGVVIALLLTAFIGLTHMHLFFKKRTAKQLEVVHNLDMGWSFFLEDIQRTGDSVTYKIPEDDTSIVGISNRYYGLFELSRNTSVNGKFNISRIAFTGSHPKERTALYLQDLNRPLVLVGQSRINGNAFLPEAGVRPGNIAGNSFYGSKLIDGQLKRSTASLPALKKEALSVIEALIASGLIEVFEPVTSLKMKMARSFDNKTGIYREDGALTLQNMKASGNLVFRSTATLRVTSSALLEDVILIAPVIRIERGVSGNFQAIATKKIYVDQGANLQYPSALILINDIQKEEFSSVNTTDPNQILIAENASVKGMLLYLEQGKHKDGRPDFQPRILLEENSELVGEVYCQSNLELKGTIKGSVYTRGFVAQQFGSIYQNHIYNGNILGEELPKEYGGLPLENTSQTIIKWLY